MGARATSCWIMRVSKLWPRADGRARERGNMKSYTLDDLARLVDHTNLHPDATREDMERLCD